MTGSSSDVHGSQEEKTDVNTDLDIVLQRKLRNSVTGFVLVSYSSETTRPAQMDLVLARRRAEAANVPIHSFGYDHSHDPVSLWLMSNHTSGTYTFVKDWYDLRDCQAGCIGHDDHPSRACEHEATSRSSTASASGSFFDLNAANLKIVSGLAHPVLLTVTLLPNTGSLLCTLAPTVPTQ
ncbi:hypothetical protein LXA43DRAFT_1092595 [Ganoderma leucocontextum]|nr:hypothetical protein LXA43DRAFT_1092595 [Ganoderma leucocontextum]